MDKKWKVKERLAAKFFGTVRNSLSGGNSKMSRSDSCHPDLYLEVKSGKRHKIWSLYESTVPRAKKERKIPVLMIYQDGKHGGLVTVHSQDFKEVAIKFLKSQGHTVGRK